MFDCQKALVHLLLLEDGLLDGKWLLVSSQGVVSSEKFVKVVLRLRKERSP